MIETVLACPLGSKCEEIKDNKLHRCAWLVELKGSDPQTGENKDEKACSITWLPILQIEASQVGRGARDAVISMREETIKRQDAFLSLAVSSQHDRLLENEKR